MKTSDDHEYYRNEYDGMSDEELVKLAKTSDNQAIDLIFERYKDFVRSKARSYFIIGADREDIVQEGMIGLYKAVRDFEADRLVSFHAFADICITRQIITAIKTATRQKHQPLNTYVSLNKPIFEEDSDRSLLDVITSSANSNPELMMIHEENRSVIEQKMSELLSDLEWEVLTSYLQDKSYQEIAADLNRQVKSIDNALQRVKRKLDKYIEI